MSGDDQFYQALEIDVGYAAWRYLKRPPWKKAGNPLMVKVMFAFEKKVARPALSP